MLTDARWKLANVRGQVCLEHLGNILKAAIFVTLGASTEEGLLLTCGLFYIAAWGQLEDFIEMLDGTWTTAATTTRPEL